VLNVSGRLRLVAGLAAFHSVAVLAGTALGASSGLIGASLGWAIGQGATLLVYLGAVIAVRASAPTRSVNGGQT
jgi:hypothetical protein